MFFSLHVSYINKNDIAVTNKNNDIVIKCYCNDSCYYSSNSKLKIKFFCASDDIVGNGEIQLIKRNLYEIVLITTVCLCALSLLLVLISCCC